MLLQTGDHGSALATAATSGQTKMVKFLVQQGADVNMPLQGRKYNGTLTATVAAGHTEIIKFLLQKGAI
jgi:ankyrin repeat protein